MAGDRVEPWRATFPAGVTGRITGADLAGDLIVTSPETLDEQQQKQLVSLAAAANKLIEAGGLEETLVSASLHTYYNPSSGNPADPGDLLSLSVTITAQHT